MDHHPGCTTGINEVSGEHDMNHSHIPANILIQFVSRHRFGVLDKLILLAVIVLVLALAGCGGGASTETLPVTNSAISNSYTGPAPATAAVKACIAF